MMSDMPGFVDRAQINKDPNSMAARLERARRGDWKEAWNIMTESWRKPKPWEKTVASVVTFVVFFNIAYPYVREPRNFRKLHDKVRMPCSMINHSLQQVMRWRLMDIYVAKHSPRDARTDKLVLITRNPLIPYDWTRKTLLDTPIPRPPVDILQPPMPPRNQFYVAGRVRQRLIDFKESYARFWQDLLWNREFERDEVIDELRAATET